MSKDQVNQETLREVAILEERAYDNDMALLVFAEQMSELMERQNLQPEDLAKRVGKTKSYIKRVLAGTVKLRFDEAANLARALGFHFLPSLVATVKQVIDGGTVNHIRPADSMKIH